MITQEELKEIRERISQFAFKTKDRKDIARLLDEIDRLRGAIEDISKNRDIWMLHAQEESVEKNRLRKALADILTAQMHGYSESVMDEIFNIANQALEHEQ